MATTYEQIPYWGGTQQLNQDQVLYQAGPGATNPQEMPILTGYPVPWDQADPVLTPPAPYVSHVPTVVVVDIPPGQPPPCTTCGIQVPGTPETQPTAVPEPGTGILLASAIALTLATRYLLRRIRTA